MIKTPLTLFITLLLFFNLGTLASADIFNPKASIEIDAPVTPTITADSSSYNENSGRYTLTGNVKIKLDNLIIVAPTAKISNDLRVWTESNTNLSRGELIFTSDALYAELLGGNAWFFGSRCSLTRPGLAIHSDTMNYNWNTNIVTFDGHVYCVQRGRNTTASHLEFDLARNEIVASTNMQ